MLPAGTSQLTYIHCSLSGFAAVMLTERENNDTEMPEDTSGREKQRDAGTERES